MSDTVSTAARATIRDLHAGLLARVAAALASTLPLPSVIVRRRSRRGFTEPAVAATRRLTGLCRTATSRDSRRSASGLDAGNVADFAAVGGFASRRGAAFRHLRVDTRRRCSHGLRPGPAQQRLRDRPRHGALRWVRRYNARNDGPNGVAVDPGRVYGATDSDAFALDAVPDVSCGGDTGRAEPSSSST